MSALNVQVLRLSLTKMVKREGGHMANRKPGGCDPTTAKPPNGGEAESDVTWKDASILGWFGVLAG